LLQWIGEMDGVICGDDRFTERVLRAAPRLKVIAKWGTGIDSIDQDACRRLGIAVRNTPNAFSEPVADGVKLPEPVLSGVWGTALVCL
jgi:D-3-phosphoglycerate dehydrogenase